MQAEAITEDESTQSLDLLTGSIDYDDDRATLEEELLQAEEDAQFEAASAATLGPLEDLSAKQLFAREQQLLDDLSAAAASSCWTTRRKTTISRRALAPVPSVPPVNRG